MKLIDLGEPIAIGNTAHIYRVDDKVIKVFQDYLPQQVAEYEGNKQILAYKKGLRVPEVLHITEIEGKPALIMQYVSGRPLGEVAEQHMEQLEYYLNLFVDTQLAVHAVNGQLLESMEQKLAQQIHRAAGLEEGAREKLLAALPSMLSGPSVICHGDLHPHNVLLDGNNVTIIDWVDATAGDRHADVYRTYMLLAASSVEIAQFYFKIYSQKSGVTYEDVMKWEPILAAARLGEHITEEEQKRLLSIVNKHNYI